MKRRIKGEIKVIGYYPVAGMTALYVLPFESVEYWSMLKGRNEQYIALLWNGKMYFRQLYWRRNMEFAFKFFNSWFYLNEAIRIDEILTVNE